MKVRFECEKKKNKVLRWSIIRCANSSEAHNCVHSFFSLAALLFLLFSHFRVLSVKCTVQLADDASLLIGFNAFRNKTAHKGRHFARRTCLLPQERATCQAGGADSTNLLLRTRWHVLSEVSSNQHPHFRSFNVPSTLANLQSTENSLWQTLF